MDFVSNIWSKQSKEEGENKDAKEQSSAGSGVSFLTGGVNILKSTFKSESTDEKEPKEPIDDETPDSNKQPETSSGGFMSNVWKNPTSYFKSDNNERKKSVGNENEKDESIGSSVTSGASSFMSSVLTKGTSLFKSDTVDKSPDEDFEIKTEVEGEPTEGVSQKAIGSVKNIGNFIYSAANKAGQSVSSTAKQLKQTVEHNSLFTDFTKEQHEFIKHHGGNIQVGEPPWVGCENEENVKKEILSLSQDKRNFVRAPPSGVQFDFDMQNMLPVALALLKHDENLSKMRFEIVPKLVNEESFWKNFFYRVELTKQSSSLSNMEKKQKGYASSSSSSAEGPDDVSPTNPEPEFVSDAFQGDVTAADFRAGMKQLGVDKGQSKEKDDKHWEDEITKELQEFEVVGGDVNSAMNEELEKELAGM